MKSVRGTLVIGLERKRLAGNAGGIISSASKRGRLGSSRLCCKSRRSRQMIIAHRFIGGIRRSSWERVRESGRLIKVFWQLRLSVVRFTDSDPNHTFHPALKRWAIFVQSASRTWKTTFAAKPFHSSFTQSNTAVHPGCR